MEEIIESILNKELDKIELFIKLVDNNNKIKLFYLVINEMINGKIDDIYLSNVLYQFCKNGLQVDKIKDIPIIISMIKKKKCMNSYRILMLCLKKLIYEKRIMGVIDTFKKSKAVKQKVKKIETPEEVMRLINKYLLLLAGSFDDKKYISTLKHSRMIERVTHGKITQNVWEKNQTVELKNRLRSLVKIFGLFALSNCNVKIITEEYFYEISFRKRVKYYELCINKLIGYLCSIKGAYEKYKTMKNIMDNFGGYYFDYVDDLSDDDDNICYGGYMYNDDDLNDTDSINISLVKVGDPDEIYEMYEKN